MPTYPQMHVKRIYRTAPDGTEDKTIWIDVLRVDAFYTNVRGSPDQGVYQGAVWYLRWLDGFFSTDPQPPQENQNPVRQTHALTLYDPSAGPKAPHSGDPGTVDLWLTDHMRTLAAGYWTGRMGEGARRIFKNYMASQTTDPSEYTTTRTVVGMRVVNNGLGGLDMTNPVDWDTYLSALQGGVQDTSQFVDVEVAEEYRTFQNPGHPAEETASTDPPQRARPPAYGGNRLRKTFGKDTLESLASVFAQSPSGANPIFRTDPYQVPVNVQWGGQPSTFVCADWGGYPWMDGGRFNGAGGGTVYPGGYNVYSSPDGINWQIQRLGITTTDPDGVNVDALIPYAYTQNTITHYSTAGGAFKGTPFLSAYWQQGAYDTPVPPPDGDTSPPGMENGDFWIAVHSGFDTGNPDPPPYTWPFQPLIPNQTNWVGEGDSTYPGMSDVLGGYLSGTIAPIGFYGDTYEKGTSYYVWNWTYPVPMLDGLSWWAVSSNDPMQVFVLGGQAADTGQTGDYIPFYFRSTDGKNWTQFTPPFNPAYPWDSWYTDCWFDDGSQRTLSTDAHGNQVLDGTPTKLWFSSKGTPSDPLWESHDGCVTWESSHYKFGVNPSTGKTDDEYIGDPSTGSYGEMGSRFGYNNNWSVVYGDVGGHRIGVTCDYSGDQPGTIRYGHAGTDPSTWPTVNLPIPDNAVTLAQQSTDANTDSYSVEVAQFYNDQTVMQNMVDAFQEIYLWSKATFGEEGEFTPVFLWCKQVCQAVLGVITDKINSLPGPPAPQAPYIDAQWIAYAVPPGSHQGVFVCAGLARGGYNSPWVGLKPINAACPCFWYSYDGLSWHVANYDMDVTSNVYASQAPGWLLSGNAINQIFATVPEPP